MIIPRAIQASGCAKEVHPEFEPSEAGVEAAQLFEQVERWRRVSNSAAADAGKTDDRITSGI